jgi:hypothetical protein
VRDVTNDTPIGRALALIAPRADQEQRCRELLSQCVGDVASAAPPPALPVRTTTREQLVKTAATLGRAAAAVKKLPHSRQRQLLPPSIQLLPPSIKRVGTAPPRLQDLISDPDSQDLRLSIFLNELEYAAIQADLQVMHLKVRRAGGVPNYRKQAAATWALLLLAHFGQRPTLTADRPFYTLASVLYEAATGKPDIDISRQCRAVHKQLPHRTVGQRRK